MPSKIEWTDETWNPVTGCSKVSEGCRNCYAERLYPRANPGLAFDMVALHSHRLDQPRGWRKPRKVFVCSMGDLFHRDVPDAMIHDVWNVMADCPDHTFQVLTKRPERAVDFLVNRQVMGFGSGVPIYSPLPNVWIGTSIENQKAYDQRAHMILQAPAVVHFLSLEPLLGAVNTFPFTDYFDWMIVGGESGPGARPMHPRWVRDIKNQCVGAGVPFMFKQWGQWAPNCLCDTEKPHKTIPRPEPGPMGCMFRCGKKAAGRELFGSIWDEYPEVKQ